MARRKKNPSAMATVLVLAALGVGGYLYYDKYEKKSQAKTKGTKKKQPENGEDIEGTFALNEQCATVGAEANTQENRWVAAAVVQQAFDTYGGDLPVNDQGGEPQVGPPDLSNALGPAPGNLETNRQYANAVATSVFRSMVHPNCLEKMGLAGSDGATIGVQAGENKYGPDYSYYRGQWPGDTQNYFAVLAIGVALMMESAGYVVDENAASSVMSPRTDWLLVA